MTEPDWDQLMGQQEEQHMQVEHEQKATTSPVGKPVQTESPLEAYVSLSLAERELKEAKASVKEDALREHKRRASKGDRVVVMGHRVSYTGSSKQVDVYATLKAIAEKTGFRDWKDYLEQIAKTCHTKVRYSERSESLTVW